MRRSLFGLCLVALAALVVSSAVAAPPTPTGVTASPSRVNFGRVLVGDTATQAVTFTNNTGETLALQNGYGVEPAEFGMVWVSTTLAPGSSRTLTFNFAPLSAGRYKGSLTVIFNNASLTYSSTVAVSGGAYLPKGGF